MTPEIAIQKVLDHGYVRYVDHMGGDETVISAARMSTGRGFERWDAGEVCKNCRVPREQVVIVEQRLSNVKTCATVPGYIGHHEIADFVKTPGDEKLLEYLFSNGHTTPFEMCELHVEVCAPILTFRQWHRHRTMSYNEQSARYGPLPDLFYVPDETRLAASFKASANKQASGKGNDFGPIEFAEMERRIGAEQIDDRRYYEERLDIGMAPELARLNVPVSQYSKCRVKTDLHNWLGFLRLRMHEHAQYEIRVYAEAVGKLIAALWPRTWALFEEYTLGAVRFSKTEATALRELLKRIEHDENEGRGASGVQCLHDSIAPQLDKVKRIALLKKLGLEG